MARRFAIRRLPRAWPLPYIRDRRREFTGCRAAVRWHPRSPLASLATGLLLVTWVAIQTAIIGFRHWSQSIWWVTFVLITLLATRLVRQRTTPARG
jgi:hypothetical protein